MTTPTRTRCGTCKGLGEVPMHYETGPRRFTLNWELCKECRGTGDDPLSPNQDEAVLLQRAKDEGLTAQRTDPDAKVALVSSSRNPLRFYRVTRTSCECPAHARWDVCKHRVLATHLYDTGQLPYRPATLTERVQNGWTTSDRTNAA